jgi:predicted nucleotidyltransferase
VSAVETLARHAAQRDAWLREIVERLEEDDRLVAAWLLGSLGNGTADELSDIDIFVVIDDRNAEEVLAHSLQEVARFGETTWLHDLPGNAPPGGAYVSAGFQSAPLPIAVDWYWQQLDHAVLPSDARVLFQKAAIPPATPPASFAELMSRRDVVIGPDSDHGTPSDADRIAFFWAMVPVAAKYAVRGWDERAGRILRGLEEQVDAVGASGASKLNSSGVRTPLEWLRHLTDQMDRITPSLRARGIRTPDTSYASAYIRLAEDVKQEGWPTKQGPLRKPPNNHR